MLGRGLYGVRTWFYAVHAKTYGRYQTYGFPAFPGGQADAFTLLNEFLTIASGCRLGAFESETDCR